MNKKNIIILVFSILFVLILVWGLIGSSQAANIGITCDFGIGKNGSVFCWTWHKNAIGEIGETINNIIGN